MSTVPGVLSIDARIRHVIRDYARLSVGLMELAENADLYDAGMTSHASVNLMLALENEFDVEFPDALLTRSVFSSIESIKSAIIGLLPAGSEHKGGGDSS